jgi:hypothetical protein
MQVDVPAALAAGRRGARLRAMGSAALAVVVVSGLAVTAVRVAGRDQTTQVGTAPWTATAVKPLTCTTAPFGDGGGVISVDPTGRNVLTFDMQSRPPTVVRHTDGARTVVPNHDLLADVVNRDGVVAGISGLSVWVYRGTEPQKLSLPDGYEKIVDVAINGRGDVVATAHVGLDKSAVAIWPAATPNQPRVYPTGKGGHAAGLADDGSVVVDRGLGPDSAALGWVIWRPDGTTRDLAMPPDAAGIPEAFHGSWVLGFAYRPAKSGGGGSYVPARWDPATGAVEVMSGIELPQAQARVSPTGWFIASGPGQPTVVVTADGRAFRLPQPPEAEHRYTEPVWISNDGRRMVGNLIASQPATPVARAVTWSCTPA